MSFLDDRTLDHLRDVVDQPDLSGTRYVLERELGRGGFGVVWAVHDPELGRTVALKVAAAGEARTIARLDHPGIVPVHDAGLLPDGRAFYVMKLVEGVRLDEYRGALNDRLRLFLKICDAVAFAHSRGVLHRDLKPPNIMVGQFGEVYVLDWGMPGTGTPGYVAPEPTQDERSDVFALGAVLRGLVGEERPLLAVVTKAMSQDPGARYASVSEMATDVACYLDRAPVSAYRESVFERGRRFVERNAVLLLLLASYLVVRLVLFFLRFV